ncbi:MAG: hypothetical protein Q9178_008003 [Gyalolechia marmorata]
MCIESPGSTGQTEFNHQRFDDRFANQLAADLRAKYSEYLHLDLMVWSDQGQCAGAMEEGGMITKEEALEKVIATRQEVFEKVIAQLDGKRQECEGRSAKG